MKRISLFLAAALLVAPVALQAQDAAVEERLDKLAGQIKDLIEAKDAQNKRIEELTKALRELQEQQTRPNANYATQEDLKRVSESARTQLQEIDRKRQDDNELIVKKIETIRDSLRTAAPARPGPTVTPQNDAGTRTRPEKGYEYIVKADDRLVTIAKAYNDQGVKVTVKQIIDANPGLKAENLKIGQKIFIPQP